MVAAIRVEGLGKCYRVQQGQERTSYRTLRESLAGMVRAPFRSRASHRNRDEFWALKDVSLEVQPGEVVGIIGRNGAGKSTLLKILSRITKPTKGRVHLKGRVGSLLEVGTGFHPELTGRENIYLNGSILGMSRHEIERKFDEIVEFSGVEKFLDTPVKRYSSGMHVRLAFAVAAHLEPEILLVDEVLAVGDAAFQKKCLGKMGQVAKEGRTVLFVSHDLANVTRLCGHGILLNGGTIEATGQIGSVVAKYLPDNFVTNDGIVDVQSRGDRSGNGDAQFQSIELMCNGKRASSFTVGGPLSIVLRVAVKRPIDSAFLAIRISTSDGVPVHEFFNEDYTWTGTSDCHQFSVTLSRLRLYPGNYVIDVYIGDASNERVDYIRNALSFDVKQTAESGIGRTLRRSLGLVLQEADWLNGELPQSEGSKQIV